MYFKDPFLASLLAAQWTRFCVGHKPKEFIPTILAENKIALATSTTQDGVSVILGKNGLNILDLFDFWVCGDDVQKSKPDPEIYQRVKGHFGEAFNYLVFEDAASGVAAAKSADMACIAVPNRFTMKQEGLSLATKIITDLTRQAQLI